MSKRFNRWRLVLGRYAERSLDANLSSDEQRMERALDYLYSREYRGRGVRQKGNGGTLDPSQLTVPKWLDEVSTLFPKETLEVIERHALERYEMTEILNNPETLAKLEPDMDLLRLLLTFRARLGPGVQAQVREIVRKVVEEIKNRLKQQLQNRLTGKLNRFRRTHLKVRQNLDWRTTIRNNLRHYDPRLQKIIFQDIRFYSRIERRLPWRIILCVDQSASMAGSVVYSAVMASILSQMPSIEVKLVLFDTSVVDLSEQAHDPVEVMMTVQLGGGTNIAQALAYCEQLVVNAHRTLFVLVSDFEEGGSVRNLLAACHRLKEAGVTLLGLAALDETANPVYDRQVAERLASNGMDIAALTPNQLAQWLAKIIS